MGTKILFVYGEARSIGCDCTHEEKTVFLGLLKMVAMETSHTLLRL